MLQFIEYIHFFSTSSTRPKSWHNSFNIECFVCCKRDFVGLLPSFWIWTRISTVKWRGSAPYLMKDIMFNFCLFWASLLNAIANNIVVKAFFNCRHGSDVRGKVHHKCIMWAGYLLMTKIMWYGHFFQSFPGTWPLYSGNNCNKGMAMLDLYLGNNVFLVLCSIKALFLNHIGAPQCTERFNSRNGHTVSNDLDSMNTWIRE